jgi:predicted MPP superfamily phosphohydrolase
MNAMTTPLKSAGTAAAWLAGAGVVGVTYAGLVERNAFALRRFDVPVLPHTARPLRVLHLSDLHLVPRQRRKIAWVRSLAAERPDLVVNTGDNIADMAAVPAALEAMEPLLQVPGVFVMGSNDYWAPKAVNPARYLSRNHGRSIVSSTRLPTEALVQGFRDAGWLDLNNRRAHLRVGQIAMEFRGVDDPHAGYDRYAEVAGPADPSAALTVGVVHAPYQRVLDAMTFDGAGLLFAGHTHGGQLAVPVYGALVTNCDLDRGRAKGVSRWWPGAGSASPASAPPDAAWMHVSAGLGTSPYAPVRFACRPEATLLTLRPRVF